MSLNEIYRQVPTAYYYHSLQTNPFQRFWHTQRFKVIGTLLSQRKVNLLDIGCADGVFTNEIAKVLHRQSSVTGVDIHISSINFARRKFPHIKFYTAAAENLPFQKHTFDLITCLEMLEHVKNPLLVLQEMRRILKPNGRAVILVPQETLLFKSIWFVWTKFKGKVWNHAHMQHFYFDSLNSFFVKNRCAIKYRRTFLGGMLMVFEVTL